VVYDLPHLLVPGDPATDRFQPRGGGGGRRRIQEIANRQDHARVLRGSLEGAIEAFGQAREHWTEELRARGVILAVVGWPGGFELALESLDLRGSDIELLSVLPAIDEPPSGEVATVFVPDSQVQQFFIRLDSYAHEETQRGTPRHEKLIANIAALQQATLEQLWTDQRPFPHAADTEWFEVWLRRTGDERRILEQISESAGWETAARTVEFPKRTVAAVRTTVASLRDALSSRLPMAEVRFASLIQSPAELHPETQRQWVEDLLERVNPAPREAPAVCLLDTGVYQHSLFAGSLDPGDILHVVGPDGVDRNGHGTEMAGVALFGDLTDPMTSGMSVHLHHRLESVKILPDPGAAPSPPETYGAVTAAGVAVPEASTPTRRRVFCLASSDHGSRSDGRPTLWSATIDALGFGTDVVATDSGLELLSEPDPESSRLLVVAAGNVRDDYDVDFLDICDTSAIEDPGQSWNALTVGAFTELDTPPAHADFAGYTTLAQPGELSPFSRTSVLFSKIWALKPDIVMEGGNLLVSPAGDQFDMHDVVSIPTTSHRQPLGSPLTTTNATSAAAAQAARLAAMVSASYPAMWPETVRGLLIHAAEWTAPMAAAVKGVPTKTGRRQLLRRYGFGTPTAERVLRSASNAVTLIAQSHIQPFEQVNSSRTRLREMHLHDLPWPEDQLLTLGDTPVRLRVTLSYFIEPNASSRGWRGRYVYPSHGLRFDIRRPGESIAEFRRRLNGLAEVEEDRTRHTGEQEPNWLIGPQGRRVGSVHADMWEGAAAELAHSGVLGVYPIGGWWKNNNRADRNDLFVRYALLVSLSTPEVTIDLYTPIATEIGIPVEIET